MSPTTTTAATLRPVASSLLNRWIGGAAKNSRSLENSGVRYLSSKVEQVKAEAKTPKILITGEPAGL